MENRKQIYISGPLTNSVREELYKSIGNLVNSLGYKPSIHLHTSQNATSKDVYTTDMEKSYMVIAYVGTPSQEVAAELECANAKGIPIILLYEDLNTVSQLVREIPSVWLHVKIDPSDKEFSALYSLWCALS